MSHLARQGEGSVVIHFLQWAEGSHVSWRFIAVDAAVRS